MTTVVNIRRDAYDVYVGRPGLGREGPFGNPYPIGQICSRCKKPHMTAASTLPCFAAYFDQRTTTEAPFRIRVLELRDKRLGCFCKKYGNEPCHGDVIASWLDGDYAAWRVQWGLV